MKMDLNIEQLAARFRLLETHELLRLSSTELSETARTVLQQELDNRNIPAITQDMKPSYTQHSDSINIYASAPERIVARLIDIAIVYMFIFIADSHVIPTAIPAIIAVLYILFQDSIFYGKSIGKIIMKITVLRENTKQTCSPWQSVVRNCFLWVLGIIDLLLLINKKKQRIGDWAARTIVINDRNLFNYQKSKTTDLTN